MALAGVIEDALSRGGLAGINVRGNTDVTIHIERRCASHGGFRYQR
jgi:hypothetical protein